MFLKEKLVSIIVPMFNSEKYITTTLDSFVSQSYKNIEVIVVDDGSKDNSAEIVKEYAIKKSKVRYIYQDNYGAPTARNLGLENSNGDYVIFFDSDDVMADRAVELFIKELEKTDSDLIIGDYKYINKNNLQIDSPTNPYFNEFINEFPTYELLAFLDPIPGNKMYKKSFLINHNIIFDNVKIGQDLNFYLKAIGNEAQIALVSETALYYRVHEGSISKTYKKTITDIVNSFKHIEKHQYNLFIKKPFIMPTLKYNHYTYQILKVPKIKSKASRQYVYDLFSIEFERISRDSIIREFVSVNPKLIYLILKFRNFYTSDFLSKILRLKRIFMSKNLVRG